MKELMHGKVKTLYDTDDAQKVLIKYEDKVTAFDGKMPGDGNHDKFEDHQPREL